MKMVDLILHDFSPGRSQLEVADYLGYAGGPLEFYFTTVTAIKTRYLTFVDQIIDPQTGLAAKGPREILSVAWSDAMAVAGRLFQPVPNLYPPRYRSLGFPDADMWGKLRTNAVD